MDKLLCLLEKYRCHLNRGNKLSVDFLRDNYSEYISDVKAALSPVDNQLVGAEMCKMVSEQIYSPNRMHFGVDIRNAYLAEDTMRNL